MASALQKATKALEPPFESFRITHFWALMSYLCNNSCLQLVKKSLMGTFSKSFKCTNHITIKGLPSCTTFRTCPPTNVLLEQRGQQNYLVQWNQIKYRTNYFKFHGSFPGLLMMKYKVSSSSALPKWSQALPCNYAWEQHQYHLPNSVFPWSCLQKGHWRKRKIKSTSVISRPNLYYLIWVFLKNMKKERIIREFNRHDTVQDLWTRL